MRFFVLYYVGDTLNGGIGLCLCYQAIEINYGCLTYCSIHIFDAFLFVAVVVRLIMK